MLKTWSSYQWWLRTLFLITGLDQTIQLMNQRVLLGSLHFQASTKASISNLVKFYLLYVTSILIVFSWFVTFNIKIGLRGPHQTNELVRILRGGHAYMRNFFKGWGYYPRWPFYYRVLISTLFSTSQDTWVGLCRERALAKLSQHRGRARRGFPCRTSFACISTQPFPCSIFLIPFILAY